jgi:glycerophosphoryl diester phosphodiesterase
MLIINKMLFQSGFAIIVVGLLAAPVLAHLRHAPERTPLVIGHRGASGYLPEHTLERYALAIELGADYIDPDLVMTQDGHLVARHEPNIMNTTPERPQQFNGVFEIPTLEAIIDLVKRKGKEKGRTIGIYPETKHPTYHRALGLSLEGKLVRGLQAADWDHRDAPVYIQSFEPSSLKILHRLTRVRLVHLVDANDVNPDGTLDFTTPFDRPYDWTASGNPQLLARRFDFLVTDEGLREVRKYADGIGPWKRYIVSTAAEDLNGDGVIGDENGDGQINEADRQLLPPTDLIQRAHAHGLLVHTWTFRNEQF